MKTTKRYKLLKCNIFLSIFLLTSFSSFPQQYNVKGRVQNPDSTSLPYANISIYNETETKLITYVNSDATGYYSIDLNKGTYLFKVSFMGYKSSSITKNIEKNEQINFELTEDAKIIDEIIIKSKSIGATVRNDTTKYNLKNLTTGNEENLRDVLKKLPGVQIDDDGKIIANGKKIDKLLIDGQEFFGDQHQLATENIGSEMLKGISLIDNYNDFSDFTSQEKTGETAMNIEISEEYKGNISGNITAGGGHKNKYELNTNLFTFRKKTNLFFIANANNIGNQTFTFTDYISFRGGVQKFISDNNSTVISTEDLPSYLIQNNNVKNKNEQFSALNFSFNHSKKLQLNSYIIFDRNSINEQQLINQNYYNQNINLNIKNSKNNTFLVNNSFINVIYRPSNKTIFEYILNFSPQKIDFLSDYNQSQQEYNTTKKQNDLSFSQALNIKNKINKFVLSATIYQSLKKQQENLNIISDNEFLNLLFPNSLYSATQNIDNKRDNYGLNTFISTKILKKSFVKLKYQISENTENFHSDIENNPQINDIKLKVLENKLGINFYNSQKVLINYNIGCDFSLININKLKNKYFLPYANLIFNFGKSHNLKINYRRTLDLPAAEKIQSNSYIKDYKTIAVNQNITTNTITKYDEIGLKYLIHDLFSGTLFSIGANYSLANNNIANNTEYFKDFIINKYIIGDFNSKTTIYLIFDKKLSNIPFNIRIKSIFYYIKKNDYIFEIPNSYTYNTLNTNIKISSNFKKSIINFDLGYQRKQSLITSKNYKKQSKVIMDKPYLNIYLNYKEFGCILNTEIDYYQSKTLNKQHYTFNSNLFYKTKNKKWKFYIKSIDLLNLNNNYILENSAYDNYFEEKIISTMSGYVIVGMMYKF